MTTDEISAFAEFILATARTTPSDVEAIGLIRSRLTDKFKQDRQKICAAIIQMNTGFDSVATLAKFTKQEILKTIRELP